MQKYNFQYCQKIIVFSKDKNKVLLCKRKGEADYDGTFSFIGGKMETTDQSIVDGLKREKDEELGKNFQLLLYARFSVNVLFRKQDGNSMILPHYLAIYHQGEIELSEEYSQSQWVEINELNEFEPKIPTIPDIVFDLLSLTKIIDEKDIVLI